MVQRNKGSSDSSCNRNLTSLTSNVSTPLVEAEYDFDWDDSQQGNMLGAYFYGYAAGMPLAGWWSTKFGPRMTTGVSMAIGTILTFVYPLVVSIQGVGYYIGFAARIALGFAHSPNFPTVQGSWHPWAPIQEKTKLISSIFLGVPVGSVVASTLGGRLCTWFGWRSVFWAAGACNIVFVLLWFSLVTDTPEEHSLISDEEKSYIISTRVQQKRKRDLPPLKNFFTSLPMIACWVAHTTHLYLLYCTILMFPKYLRDVQGFSIKEIGDLAALPQVMTIFVIFGGGFIADFLQNKGYSLLTIRRATNFLGSVVPGLICLCFYFVTCNIIAAMGIMITVQTLCGFQHPSSKTNVNDVVPAFAAVGMSIGNTFGSIMGFVAPAVAGFLLKNYGNTFAIWNSIWLICGCVITAGGLFYSFCSSADALPWTQDNDEEKNELKN